MYLSIYIYPSTYLLHLSVCMCLLAVRLSDCCPVKRSFCLSFNHSICDLSICPSTHPCIYLSVYPISLLLSSLFVFVYLCISLFSVFVSVLLCVAVSADRSSSLQSSSSIYLYLCVDLSMYLHLFMHMSYVLV